MRQARPSAAVPRWIPVPMRSRLDLGELAAPDAAAAVAIRRLERRLRVHVAVYRAGARGRPVNGLCSTYRAARLARASVRALAATEARCRDVVLVAYARPLERYSTRGRREGDMKRTTAGATSRSPLLDAVDQAYDKQSWHGTNLRGALRKLSIGELCWRPGRGRHNIWEIVLHAAYWKYAVWRRITGEKRGAFVEKGSNWFVRPVKRTDAAWKADLRLLQAMHDSMREAIAGVAARDLDRKSRGSRHTNAFMITGIAAHDLYHAGQIQLLKRLYARKARG